MSIKDTRKNRHFSAYKYRVYGKLMRKVLFSHEFKT